MKILVVEDDKPTTAALLEVLTAHNYVVRSPAFFNFFSFITSNVIPSLPYAKFISRYDSNSL